MKKIIALAFCFATMGAVAPAMADDQEPDYLRSSLYTILVNSKAQNQRIEDENNNAGENEFMAMAKSLAKTDQKKAANDKNNIPLSQLPQSEFLKIAIPAQFNNHNLAIRTIDFDALRSGISDKEKDAANEATGKKKSKLGGFGKALAGAALSSVAGQQVNLINTDETNDYMAAVVSKFIAQDNTAAKMIGRWFDYDPQTGWDKEMKTLMDRGLQSVSISEKATGDVLSAGAAKALNLIPNTFLMTVNLSFRSNKAILAESQKLAGGVLGSGAASIAGAAASAAAGDGYSVCANTSLYRLVWNEEHLNKVGELMDKNGTLDDLIKSGICKLEFVGKDKAKANVRQSLFSDKPISDLVARATTRAIDAAIAKLQEKNEVFRTIFPISGCDADGGIRVKIGTREGVSKGDTYAVLEKQEDNDGRISYKEIATVKPNENLIWNNIEGAAEEAAENAKSDKKNDEIGSVESTSLGYTTFAGKKGKDFNGYYVQLKKKK